MSNPGNFKENWLRPFLFFGNNPISLIGGAITSASALILIGFWIVDIFGHSGSTNPYIGLVLTFGLPALFVLGLVMIPIGIGLRRSQLLKAGKIPSVYPQIDMADPVFRHGIDFVLVATFINVIIVGTASYRAVDHMDSAAFCGATCHVPMQPEWTAYQVSPHSHVPCVECHVGSGVSSFVQAKVNGTKQLVEVVLHTYPHPIESPVKNLRPAREICEGCHTPARFIGEKLLVKTDYADDEKNSMTRTLVLLHLGGRDSLSHLTGIHGVHLGHIEYIASDSTRQTIPWVSKRNADGSTTEFVSTDAKGPIKGEKRLMDCIDCHNRAAHTFQTPEDALNRAMSEASPSASLPFIHKQGLQLIKATYASQEEAAAKIQSGLEQYYRAQYPAVWSGQRAQIDQAARTLVTIYGSNVFPEMKVTWGTHPNNVGHTNSPGCFRCHDGSHNDKKANSIPQDCATCHNLLAVDEANPKLITDLGIN